MYRLRHCLKPEYRAFFRTNYATIRLLIAMTDTYFQHQQLHQTIIGI